MTAIWFILEGEQHRGPFTADELAEALLGKERPHEVQIWREGLPDWQAAWSVPEIREKLPGVPPEFEDIAKSFRILVLLVGLQLALGFFQFPGMGSYLPSTLLLIISIVSWGILVAIAFTAYQLTNLLGESHPILWGIAMALPCVNLLCLLLISSKAQAWCRRYGIAVGLFGPTKKSIEEMRR